MRIIGGKNRGTKLYTLEGENTRPTLDRVKESLFNIIQNNITDSVFLDLFAGSGSIGLEAVSRGAKKAILCDKEIKAIDIIRKNIEKTHAQEKIELYNTSYENLLKTKIQEKIDIAYIDPPYKTDYAYEATKMLIEQNLVDKNSIIIIETDDENRIKNQIYKIEELEINDTRKYGRAHLLFIKKKNKV
jgi:16S rRNA (guanine(966)-N(2))-methyltransferase RsmD